jgi:hypothetical protein
MILILVKFVVVILSAILQNSWQKERKDNYKKEKK